MKRFTALAATGALAFGLIAGSAAAGSKGTIVDKVVELSGPSGFDDNGQDFDILRDAVVATGLAEPLGGKTQFTVFAPTDQAFLDLTGESSEAAAFDAVAALGTNNVRRVLKYHVAEGRLGAKEVVAAKKIKTLYKSKKISKEPGGTHLTDRTGRTVGIAAANAAKVDNGIIHVIDGVLLPFEL